MNAALNKACVCGHDHRTHRDERVDRCLECQCWEYIDRCQNCGAEVPLLGATETRIASVLFDVCSRRCAMQLEHLLTVVALSTTQGEGNR